VHSGFLLFSADMQSAMDTNDWALNTFPADTIPAEILISEKKVVEPWYSHEENVSQYEQKQTFATVTNGKITATINGEGWITFTDNSSGRILLEEYWRNRQRIDRYCVPLNMSGHEIKPVTGTTDYSVTARFEAYDDEKLFGMGQYQDSHLNKKGCILELAQRNSQASVPFVVSSRGYGFLWNNPAIGTASFAVNGTTWTAVTSKKLDYWITCGTPAEIERNYSAVTGHVPMMPDFAMGFWQCKLRYRTQEEVLSVAHEYKNRGLPLDVIVIDFFHWTRQGDFKFDPVDWPDPEAMVRELSSLNIKVMVSVWPTVDEKSENFAEMASNGFLISFDRGVGVNMTWMGNTTFYDATNPDARRYVWEKCKQNYFGKGISLFWLDEAEPEYGIYDFDLYRYSIGPAASVSNIYPLYYAQGFFDGLKESGVKDVVNLVRCAWAGSQKYGTVIWSGDIHSDFRTMRNQLQAGLSMGMAGIPWWTTDIGGFLGADSRSVEFHELLVRWFEWAVFCPVTRLHGERQPWKPMEQEYHGHVQQMPSGQDNEIWSFGDDVYVILKKLLELRVRLKPYITGVMKAAHKDGAPAMRPLFFSFPCDENSWEINDEYLFGPELLIAPVMNENQTKKSVYLPPLADEKWTDTFSGKEYAGGQTISADAPLDRIPVFSRGTFNIKIW
jgi:alpha-D-xyloside xylohydrolase